MAITITHTITAAVTLDAGGDGLLTVTDTGTIDAATGAAVTAHRQAAIANAGTIAGQSSGIVLEAGGTVTNAAGGEITGETYGILGTIDPITVYNAGLIGARYAVLGGDDGLVVNSGSIAAAGTYGTGIYLRSGGSVANSGQITADGTQAIGVQMAGPDASVTNTGIIATTGIRNNAVLLEDGGSVTNAAGGTISGWVAIAVTDQAGTVSNSGVLLGENAGIALLAGGTVTNHAGGTIGPDSAFNVGVYSTGARLTLLNEGTITGYNGLQVQAGGTLDNAAGAVIRGHGLNGIIIAGGSGTVSNAGMIDGATNGLVFSAAGTLDNSGTIISAYRSVALQKGGNVTNAASGHILAGPVGAWAVEIGNLPGTVANAGTIAAGTNGVVLFAGGTIVNTGWIIGTGNVGAYISGGDGTVTNAGTIGGGAGAVQFSGSHEFRLIVEPGAVFQGAVLGAYAGHNVLELAAGDHSHGTLANFTSGFTNFGTIEVDHGATWTLDGQAPFGQSVTLSNRGTLTGDVGFAFTDGGTIDNAGTAVIDADASASASGIGIIAAGVGITITNAGTIKGGVAGIAASDAASIGNSGLVSGGLYGIGFLSDGTVSNSGIGLVQGGDFGVAFYAGGSLDNSGTITASGGYAVYFGGGTGMLVNSGSIGGSFFAGGGVKLSGPGTITNQAQGRIEGGNSGSGTGIYANAGLDANWATIVNAGTVTGGADGIFTAGHATIGNTGLVTGGGSAIVMQDDGTITNSGTLAGNGTGVSLRYGGSIDNSGVIGGSNVGVYLNIGGSGAHGAITNSGTGAIRAAGAHGWAVKVSGGPASLDNRALIEGTDNGVVMLAGGKVTNSGTIAGHNNVGIYITGGDGTVHNSGTITGGASGAVFFQGSYDFRLIVDPGAVFDGAIEGGSGSNTLELAKGNGSHATLADFDPRFEDFGRLEVDDGAIWTLGGARAGALSVWNRGTLVSGGSIAGGGTVGGGGTMGGGGTIIGGGTIAGAEYALHLLAGGNIRNDAGGLITANGTAGAAIMVEGATGTLTNEGTITGTADGVILEAGGSVDNTGLILATGGNANAALAINSGTGVVTNAGTIMATDGIGLVLPGVSTLANLAGGLVSGNDAGVFAAGAATITNAGSILGNIHGIQMTGGGTLHNRASGVIGSSWTFGRAVDAGGTAATVINRGTIEGAFNGVVLTAGGSVFNSGTIIGAGNVGVYVTGGPGTLTNAGTIAGGAAAVQVGGSDDFRLILRPGAVFDGVVQGGGGSNVLELALGDGSRGNLAGFATGFIGFASLVIDAGADWLLHGAAPVGQSVTLDGDGATLAIDDPAGFTETIYDFSYNDRIDLVGISGATLPPAMGAGNVLDVQVGGVTYHFQFDPGADYSARVFQIGDDGAGGLDISAPCYCPGTHIRTPDGEVVIEALRVGDLVLTHDGAARPIVWIGRRGYAGRFLAGQRHILPIRIRAGALADNVPTRDLLVSPQHAMFLDGALVPAMLLVNGSSITQEQDAARVDYVHLDLAGHAVLWAEGAAAESFVDDDSRWMFHNAAEYAGPRVPARYCAPRLTEGYRLEELRQRIAVRAGQAVAAPAIGALRGYIDADGAELHGWAQDALHPEAPVCLDILLDGEIVAQLLADRFRPDLRRAGLGSGCHAFVLTRPGPGLLTIRRTLDGAELRRTAERRAA